MRFLSILFVVLGLSASAQAADRHPALSPFEPFIGKTWVFETEGYKDVAHWDWVHGGQAILIQHTVNDGEYGGTTLVNFDQGEGVVIYRYATAAGFYTDGRMTATSDGYIALEQVSGHPDGITEVRSGARIKDGVMHKWVEFLKNGAWGPRQELSYKAQ